MKRCKLGLMGLWAVGAVGLVQAAGEDPRLQSLEQAVAQAYTLSLLTPDGRDLGRAGTVLVLRKGAFSACPVGQCKSSLNIYKDGVLSQDTSSGGFLDGFSKRQKWVPGARFYVVKVMVTSSGLYLGLLSDPVGGLRQGGLLEIPFAQGVVPTADQVLARLSEVVSPVAAALAVPAAPGAPAPATAPAQTAAAPRSVDVRTFEVAGVMLGMDGSQVRKALAEHFKVPAAKIKDSLPVDGQLIQGRQYPGFLTYRDKDQSVTVYLVPRIPEDPAHPQTVSEIDYVLGQDVSAGLDNRVASKGSADNMRQAVIEKYGPPSYQNALSHEWCAGTAGSAKWRACDQAGAALVLLQDMAKLQLLDREAESAAHQASEAARDTKPNF